MQMPLQLMVSSQLMYQLLYCDGKSQVTSENCCGTELRDPVPKPVMKKHEVHHYRDAPVVVKKDIKLEEPKLPPLLLKHVDSLQTHKEKVNAPWKFDTYRPVPFEPACFYEVTSDERWLDSVFSEINGGLCSLPRTLDDISALLDLPDNLPAVSLEDQF